MRTYLSFPHRSSSLITVFRHGPRPTMRFKVERCVGDSTDEWEQLPRRFRAEC